VINLLSGGGFAFAVTQKLPTAFFGLLTSPSAGNHPQRAIDIGVPWACDNDCFVRYDPIAIHEMLVRYKGLKGCVFMNAPDVIQSHSGTLKRFHVWERIIHGMGFPVSFTLHNGCTVDTVPWDKCDALFIGGNNAFKYSAAVPKIVAEAVRRGMWVHHGRVNSRERIIYSRNMGCASFDGTGFSVYPPKILALLPYHTGHRQPSLLPF